MSYNQVSKAIGCDRKTLYRYVYGESTPDILNVAKLCYALNVKIDWLVMGRGEIE